MIGLLTALTISRIQSAVEVPFKIADDAIVVEATVNGKRASFMFDTGYAGTVVLGDDLNVGVPTGTTKLRDFVGELTVKTINLRSLKVGALDASDVQGEIVQQPLGRLSMSYNAHTDGIMGLNVIKNRVTELNFEKSKFIFYPDSFDISKRVPDNKRTFLVKMLPIGQTSIELDAVTPSGKRMILALDTGNAFYATTHKDVLVRTGLWPADKKPTFMRTAFVASGPVDSWMNYMPPLKIFSVPVERSVWDIIDLPASSAEGDGTVGVGFLRNFNIIIDMPRRRVWLENFTGKVSNEVLADIGISVRYDPRSKRMSIVRVMPASPADRAGLKEGDTVLSVDGQDIEQTGFRKFETLLQGPAGSKVSLAVSQRGELRRLELVRELLINSLPPAAGQ